MSIQIIITILQQYKFSWRTRILANKYPFELKARIAYIDNLVLQLSYIGANGSAYRLKLIADDIYHCLRQNYYPLLPTEKSNNFSFFSILRDVCQLIELETAVSGAYAMTSEFAASEQGNRI